MDQWLISFGLLVKLTFFVIFFTLLAYWQTKHSYRRVLVSIKTRWVRHFSLSALGLLAIKLCYSSLLPLAIAGKTSQSTISLLTYPPLQSLPYGVKVFFSVILLDLAIYLQHRAFHRYQLAWRFHKVHHADRDFEVSTGVRFHPLEMVVTMMVKIIAIIIIAPPILGVLIFEILLNAALLFTHTNVEISPEKEKILRYFIVTPTMHKIHHSEFSAEHNSNYGFLLSCWDRLFGTYVPYPRMGDKHMNIGLSEYHEAKYKTLKNMLYMPFESVNKKPIKQKKVARGVP